MAHLKRLINSSQQQNKLSSSFNNTKFFLLLHTKCKNKRDKEIRLV